MRGRLAVAILLLLISTNETSGQSSQTMRRLATPSDQGLGGMSTRSPWIGSQVNYLFGDGNSFAESILVSAQGGIPIELGTRRFALDVFGSFGALTAPLEGIEANPEAAAEAVRSSLYSNSGLSIGLFPSFATLKTQYLSVLSHGVIAYKGNGVREQDSSPASFMNAVRVGAGLELAVGDSMSPLKRVALGAMPTFSSLSGVSLPASVDPNVFAIELSLLLPVPLKGFDGFGLLFESQVIRGSTPGFRVGFLKAHTP